MEGDLAINDFWCDHCREDWTLDCRIRGDYGTEIVNVSGEKVRLPQLPREWFVRPFKVSDRQWYIATCPKCDRELVRDRTYPKRDPYFWKSDKIRREAIRYARDLLQPGDPGFDLAYPKWKRERLAKENESEVKKWKENKKTKKRIQLSVGD